MSSETDTKAMQDMTEAPVGQEGGIRRVAPEVPFTDVMNGDSRWEIPIHDHGFVALVDSMPRLVPEGQTADSAIVQAARVSYGAGTKKVNEDRGLIRYLLRHRHTTPLEMVEFKFHIAMPIFVARQWIRQRTSTNIRRDTPSCRIGSTDLQSRTFENKAPVIGRVGTNQSRSELPKSF